MCYYQQQESVPTSHGCMHLMLNFNTLQEELSLQADTSAEK